MTNHPAYRNLNSNARSRGGERRNRGFTLIMPNRRSHRSPASHRTRRSRRRPLLSLWKEDGCRSAPLDALPLPSNRPCASSRKHQSFGRRLKQADKNPQIELSSRADFELRYKFPFQQFRPWGPRGRRSRVADVAVLACRLLEHGRRLLDADQLLIADEMAVRSYSFCFPSRKSTVTSTRPNR